MENSRSLTIPSSQSMLRVRSLMWPKTEITRAASSSGTVMEVRTNSSLSSRRAPSITSSPRRTRGIWPSRGLKTEPESMLQISLNLTTRSSPWTSVETTSTSSTPSSASAWTCTRDPRRTAPPSSNGLRTEARTSCGLFATPRTLPPPPQNWRNDPNSIACF